MRVTRKPNREQLEEQNRYHEQQHFLYMCALQYVMRKQVTQVCTTRDKEGNRYTYQSCGETRADGGFVLITFKANSAQEADTRVCYIEQEYGVARTHAHMTEDCRAHYEGMTKVLMHRIRVLEGTHENGKG